MAREYATNQSSFVIKTLDTLPIKHNTVYYITIGSFCASDDNIELTQCVYQMLPSFLLSPDNDFGRHDVHCVVFDKYEWVVDGLRTRSVEPLFAPHIESYGYTITESKQIFEKRTPPTFEVHQFTTEINGRTRTFRIYICNLYFPQQSITSSEINHGTIQVPQSVVEIVNTIGRLIDRIVAQQGYLMISNCAKMASFDLKTNIRTDYLRFRKMGYHYFEWAGFRNSQAFIMDHFAYENVLALSFGKDYSMRSLGSKLQAGTLPERRIKSLINQIDSQAMFSFTARDNILKYTSDQGDVPLLVPREGYDEPQLILRVLRVINGDIFITDQDRNVITRNNKPYNDATITFERMTEILVANDSRPIEFSDDYNFSDIDIRHDEMIARQLAEDFERQDRQEREERERASREYIQRLQEQERQGVLQ